MTKENSQKKSSSSSEVSMNDILGENLMMEILSRLVIEDMAICCCVCKSWNALVNDPSFMKSVYDRVSEAERIFKKDLKLFCEIYHKDDDDNKSKSNNNNKRMRLIDLNASSIAKGMKRKASIITKRNYDLRFSHQSLDIAYIRAVNCYSPTAFIALMLNSSSSSSSDDH
ncbi:putative F-box protein At5g36200 [Prosopis cineraria]|uniref:putative F-box protein At5g36200 n=1 Tax=Prosopis cineraria TaxID=364024 RepID=UPI002410009B|nr:putative F-box protein At5g36200 [Prosopis cineraria]